MLKEAMLALRVTDMEYAADIKRLLIAGKRDLEIAGVKIQGEILITITEDAQTGVITADDTSTITDDLVITAIITYAGARGNYAGAEERARLDASYDLQRRQLANATGYTDFTGAADAEGGAASLDTGLATIIANNEALNNGAQTIFAAILSSANAQLSASGLDAAGIEIPELTAENYAEALYTAAQGMDEAVRV